MSASATVKLNEAVPTEPAAGETAANGASVSLPVTPKPPDGRPGGPKTPRAAKVIVKTMQLEGGGKVEERGDGSRLQINPDGSTVETFSPDSPRRHETKTNGDWLDVDEDGTETKFDAATGLKVTLNKDGSSRTEHSDGMVIEESPSKRVEIRTDGSRLEIDKESGVSLESFEDGTQVQTMPNKARILIRVSGHSTQRNPDGSVIESYPDGRQVQTSVGGTRIERYADGRQVQTDTSGTVIEQLADGTRLPPKQPKITQRCVSCSNCASIVTVPSDSFVICCPFCQQIMLGHKVSVIGSTQTVAEGLAAKASRPLWGENHDAAADIKAIFDRYDQNRSGGIDQVELSNMLEELHFPRNAFGSIFDSADENHDGELQFPEFVQYFNDLNSAVIGLAAMPDLAMSAQMMEDQKSLLMTAHEEISARLVDVDAKLGKANISNCDELADEKRMLQEQIVSIDKELALRSRHLETAVKEQHRRRREALHKKLADRKAGRTTPPVSPKGGVDSGAATATDVA